MPQACPKHAHMSNIMDFRLLEKGEQIQEGDEIFLGTWEIAPPSMIGAHWTPTYTSCVGVLQTRVSSLSMPIANLIDMRNVMCYNTRR